MGSITVLGLLVVLVAVFGLVLVGVLVFVVVRVNRSRTPPAQPYHPGQQYPQGPPQQGWGPPQGGPGPG